jgi:hypothetical protein
MIEKCARAFPFGRVVFPWKIFIVSATAAFVGG